MVRHDVDASPCCEALAGEDAETVR